MRPSEVGDHGYERDLPRAASHLLENAKRNLLAKGVHGHHQVRPVCLEHSLEPLVAADVHQFLRKAGREKDMHFASSKLLCAGDGALVHWYIGAYALPEMFSTRREWNFVFDRLTLLLWLQRRSFTVQRDVKRTINRAAV